MNLKSHIPLTVVAFAAMLCLPSAASAQSILLSADNFALLGDTSITVNGAGPTTIANGNVGLSSGATSNITGFPPATITGLTSGGLTAAIIATGGETSQAGLDLITARNGLAGMASDTNLSNTDLGGMTLTPGVYTFDAAAGLTGALTLDANGQNNAFWVFQISTALTSSVNSTVTLINVGTNGGSDVGIFWNAGAEIILGDSNTMLGNLISGTSITLGVDTQLNGRALAGAAVTFNGAGGANVFGGPASSSYNGGLMYNGSAVVPLTAVPEPLAVLWLTPLSALGFVIWRRRQARATTTA